MGGYQLVHGCLALGTPRAQRRRAPPAARLREADPWRPVVVGGQRSRPHVVGMFQHPDPRPFAIPIEVGTAVLDRDYERAVHRGYPLPGTAARQRRTDERPPTRIQISNTMMAPITEPMMPEGWKNPFWESLWKIR
jgi:hypothetical protein